MIIRRVIAVYTHSIVEAQAAGCPVIAYGQGGPLETVTEQTGLLFEEQTTHSLMDAIQKFERIYSFFCTSDLVKNTQKFDEENFIRKFSNLVRAQKND